MINKIHYIWLGGQLPLSNLAIVDEWKSMHPNFEFYFWNDNNIEIYDCLFLRQCLRKKAYAFAADYIRLKVVNEYGGFYMDTDMKLLKPLSIEHSKGFEICEEEVGRANWAYFYSEPNHKITLSCLKKYEGLIFDQFKPPVIPYFLNEIIQNSKDQASILSKEVFYSLPATKNLENYNQFITDQSIGVHLWDFSWKELKRERPLFAEVIYRLRILFVDFLSMGYPKYYFRVNLERIYRLVIN